LGIDFGDHSLVWGVEGFAGYDDHYGLCEHRARRVLGPLARFTLHGASRPEFTLSGLVGRQVDIGGPAVGAELGVTMGFPKGIESDALFLPHTAVGFEVGLASFQARQEWLLSYTVDAGVHILPFMDTLGECVAGRPQRDADGHRVCTRPPTTRTRRRDRRRQSPNERYAARLRSSAHEEFESVAAFLNLATDLGRVGAPPELSQRARLAAREELEHTALVSNLVSHVSGVPFEPTPPRILSRPVLDPEQALRRLARESWLDGCLGEALSAALAAHESQTADDALVRSVHAQIARDEHQHAELAWDILAWCSNQDAQLASELRTSRFTNVSAKGDRNELGQVTARVHTLARQRLADLL
jgi:hypothetical protein